MREQWHQLMEKLDGIERLLQQIFRQEAEKDVGNNNKALLSLKQAAAFLHLSESSMYKLIYKKKLVPVQRSTKSKILFEQGHLVAFMKQSNNDKKKQYGLYQRKLFRKPG